LDIAAVIKTVLKWYLLSVEYITVALCWPHSVKCTELT